MIEFTLNTIWRLGFWQVFRVFLFVGFGYTKLRPFKANDWHFGCKYFTALAPCGDAVFIKTSGKFLTAKREIVALGALASAGSVFPRCYKSKMDGVFSFCAIEYVNGFELESLHGDIRLTLEINRVFLKEKIEHINLSLIKSGIYHRDIRPSNVLLEFGGDHLTRVILIDFGFSVSNTISGLEELPLNAQNLRVLSYLGETYRKSPSCWDDTWSLMKLSSVYGVNVDLENNGAYSFSI